MPRSLGLGVLASAICVLAALALVRALGPGQASDSSVGHVAAETVRPDAEVLLASEAAPVERAAIPSPSASESSAPPTAPLDQRRVGDRSEYVIRDRPPGGFEDGIVEVHVVRDEDGKPIAGADVHLGTDAQTDAQGVATFTGVSEYFAEVTASFAGRATAAKTASFSPESPLAVVELRLAVQRDVVVQLHDALGRPFRAEDWHIARRAADRLGILLTRSCGAIGRSPDVDDAPAYRARTAERELGPFTWKLEVQAPGEVCVLAVLGDVIVGAERLDPRATEVSVRVDPAAIESVLAPVVVRVLAAAGDVPIEGALVELEANVAKAPKLTTGADGRVSVGFANSGLANLVVTARGFAPARIAVARPFPPEFVARLVPGRRIEGRVVDQDGAPISGARIELPGAEPGVAATMRSAAGGEFRFHDLPSAEFMVHATYSAKPSAGGGQRVIVKADCREGDVLDLRLEIPVANASTPATPR